MTVSNGVEGHKAMFNQTCLLQKRLYYDKDVLVQA
jgi:hypothetical protein